MPYRNFFIILITAFLWGIADLLRKVSSGRTNNQLLAFVFNLGATILPLVVLLWLVAKKSIIKYNLSCIVYSLIGGLLVGAGGILLFYLLSKGETVSTTFPLISWTTLLVFRHLLNFSKIEI